MAVKSYRFNGFRNFGIDFYNWSSQTSWSMTEEEFPDQVATYNRTNCGTQEQQFPFTGPEENAEWLLKRLNKEGEKDYVPSGD